MIADELLAAGFLAELWFYCKVFIVLALLARGLHRAFCWLDCLLGCANVRTGHDDGEDYTDVV